MTVMREYVKNKLKTRMQMRQAELIPFLGYLYQKLTEQTLPQNKKVGNLGFLGWHISATR